MKTLLYRLCVVAASIKLTIAVLAMLCAAVLVEFFGNTLPGGQWLAETHGTRLIIDVLLVLFCVNLIACVGRRVPETLKLFAFSSSSDLSQTIPIFMHVESREAPSPCSSSEAEYIQRRLSAYFNRTAVSAVQGHESCVRFERNRFAHLGFYLAHAGILAMAAGLAVSQTGFRHTFEISAGQCVTPLIADDDGTPRAIPLDFSILCEKVYPADDHEPAGVKKHRSILSIINRQGRKVKTGRVSFGTPLRYKGIEIFQERFSKQVHCARIRITSKNGRDRIVKVAEGGSFGVPGSDIRIVTVRFEPHAVKLRMGSSPASLRISQRPAAFAHHMLPGYRFGLEGFAPEEVALIKLIRDPGRKIIWYAFFCMTMGFALSFFFSHEIVLVYILPQGDGCRIKLYGAASKNIEKIEKLLETSIETIQGEPSR